jgi:hypothetical protein
MARHHIPSQALGIYHVGTSDFPQLRLHLRGCFKISGKKHGLRSERPAACETASRFSRIVLWCSAALYLTGAFTAYLLGPLLVRFD